MLTALDVANYFLTISDTTENDITNLKLNKLLYYAQGFHLAALGEPLFAEDMEAWLHGPVVPKVYHNYKNAGSDPLKRTKNVDFDQIPKKTEEILDEVYSVFGQYSASTLRNWTHDEPPWKSTPMGEVITKDKLEKYFKTRIEK